ncbi:hypothetical protein DPMN_088309 [Dreissena polymorpha]|uniref:Uncharacterized protein n=1 Tax=Dreissena polymorpha TaxID=45954 RepID=A0A9D4QWZ3_DREPO|nr:hypothetical protein DPMN_088309 [Dreissena polymorpha]
MPRPRGGHVFKPTGIIFELVQDIIGMNLLTEFHEDRTIHVASRVKNAPPPGGHVFQANDTIFELIQDIIETNLLTKCHEDWTINVASRELTRQMLTPHNGRRTTDKRRSQKLTMSTLCYGKLKIQERALRFVYDDYNSSYDQLLTKANLPIWFKHSVECLTRKPQKSK